MSKNETNSNRADAVLTKPAVADIGHKIGEQNIRFLNLDIHNPVFIVSGLLVVMLVIGTLLFPQQATALFADLRVWTTVTFDWFFLSAVNIFVVFSLALALSPLGRIRLGGKDAAPHYGYLAGPTLAILGTIAKAPVDYLYYLPALSNWIGREDLAFLHDWTTFYWAWWIAWAPFVGMFIARVSYGRTVPLQRCSRSQYSEYSVPAVPCMDTLRSL